MKNTDLKGGIAAAIMVAMASGGVRDIGRLIGGDAPTLNPEPVELSPEDEARIARVKARAQERRDRRNAKRLKQFNVPANKRDSPDWVERF